MGQFVYKVLYSGYQVPPFYLWQVARQFVRQFVYEVLYSGYQVPPFYLWQEYVVNETCTKASQNSRLLYRRIVVQILWQKGSISPFIFQQILELDVPVNLLVYNRTFYHQW